jgi:ubiquitin-like modifier-activating enzyme ATG7
MKWRMAPDINLDIIKNSKFLLIGAGTLGCHVSRNLLGWGARNINFIDCGNISFSNPVRQSLYNFSDADTGKGQNPKAETAAKKLKEIFPSVNSEGFSFQIPLPGRSLIDQKAEEIYLEKIEKLEKLISENDVIFLLTDSRESRWFPTLLAKKHGKICITAAIGFDTFVVMRHGHENVNIINDNSKDKDNDKDNDNQGFQYSNNLINPENFDNNKEKIGCYFCNDIVSPVDTTFNRTLDQQCTISRPGVSAICSGYTSEIGISILQKNNSIGNDVPEVLRGNIKDSTILKIKQEKSRK